MRAVHRLARFLAMAPVVWPIICPPHLMAQQPNSAATAQPLHHDGVVRDVALDRSGALFGQVLTPEGAPVAAARVTIVGSERAAAESTTDSEGRFQVAGLRGGMYQLRSAGTSVPLRIWTHNAAPPAAAPGMLVVADGATLRGNFDSMYNPLPQIPGAAGAMVIPAAVVGGTLLATPRHSKPAS